MKKLITLCLVLWATMATWASGTIDINGTTYPVDTLACYQVGPGTMFTRFNIKMGSIEHHLYLLTADLTNPYLKAEEYQAGDKMGQTEGMVSAHHKIDSVGHHPIGSVNCNFWCVPGNISGPESGYAGLLGQPFSGTAKDGVLIGNPSNWNAQGDRGYLMIDDMNRAIIRNMKFNGRVSKGSDTGRAIRDCNRQRNNPNADEIALFNRYIGTTRAIADTVLELIFEPVQGQEWTINDTMQCVVLSRNNVGGTPLTGKQGALQGRGSRGKWMKNNLQVGDTFQIKLGMYSVSETSDDNYSGDSIAPRVMQMVTGNCLVMANGNLTSRNTNEGYNNQNYPRTMLATNNEGTKLWMLVSEKPGNYTAEMCAMLRHDGATWAAGMDGGGSAQMNLFGKILNPTTEGSPRAVANSFFLVSTAPDDNDVARLDFVDNLPTTMSSYAAYTPALRSYNQYGWLLSNDFQDYTLSCEPASLGTISADGKTFIASATGGTGRLIASYNGISASKEITVEPGTLSLRIDTLLIDTREYTIEVFSTVGSNQLVVDPSFFTWTVDDPNVCSVSEAGVIKGLSCGTTDIHGSLDGNSISMHINVEIASEPAVVFSNFANADSVWTLKNTYGDIAWQKANGKTSLTFTVNSARSPQLRIVGDLPLYSIPDSAHLVLTGNVGIKSLGFLAMANNGTKQVNCASTPTQTPGQPATYSFSAEAMGLDSNDLAIYPIHLQTLVITLQNVTVNTPYSIDFDSLILYYHNYVVSAVEDIPVDNQTRKLIINGHLFIDKDGKRYDALGNIVK